MTSSIPDSFNMDELQKALENAPQDIVDRPVEKKEYKSKREEIESVAEKALDWATEQCPDPLVHKVMMMTIAMKMVDWHTSIGIKCADEGEERSAVCWLRDAGKFQAMLDSLVNISVGPEDFTLHECGDED